MMVVLYAQEHPDDVAGVVSMNPGPTYDDWVRRLRPIVTPQELRDNEIGPRSGGVPEEPVDVRESDELLAKPFPQEIPYVVMFAVGSSPSAYLVESANQMSVVHVHADSASLDHHLDLAGPLFPEYADLVTLSSIHIYGEPSEAALGELREKLRILGAGDVIVHDPHVGFVRSVVVSRVGSRRERADSSA